jgi:putative nucleotidyltransferase with HDIG domain
LGTLAEIAGNAIHRTRLYTQTQRRLRRISALHSIDQAISANLDLESVLNVLLEQVTTQLKVNAAAILLYNPAARQLEYRASRGFYNSRALQPDQKLGEGLAGKVAQDRRFVRITDLSKVLDQIVRGPLFTQEQFIAYFGVPLFARGSLVGVLEIFHRSALNPDEEWLAFLKTLAGQAAIAIDNAYLFENLQTTNLQLKRAYDTTLEGWSRALELRDQETEGHTQRVVQLTEQVARALGLNDGDLLQIRRGTLLHDIGKMGIPDRILLKPEGLTAEEWTVMRQHPVFAYQLLSPILYLRPALDIPYYHHERWDGQGYPLGLKGQEIPLAARIFTLVDVWDALRSDRPYRPAWPKEDVIAYIREQAGRQFDPNLAPLFLNIVTHMNGHNR